MFSTKEKISNDKYFPVEREEIKGAWGGGAGCQEGQNKSNIIIKELIGGVDRAHHLS